MRSVIASLAVLLVCLPSIPAYAETWSCSYLSSGKAATFVKQRVDGGSFIDPTLDTTHSETILFENETFIHLSNLF